MRLARSGGWVKGASGANLGKSTVVGNHLARYQKFMTLIFSAASIGRPPDSFILLSDILVTTPTPNANSIMLPHMFTPQQVRFGNAFPHSVSQKTVIFGKTALHFSGHSDPCLRIAKRVYEESSYGEKYVSLSEVIDRANLTVREWSSISVATYFASDIYNLHTCGHAVSTGNIKYLKDNYEVVVSGRGLNFFLEQLHKDHFHTQMNLDLVVIQAMIKMIVDPFYGDYKSLTEKFGSWFEFTTYDPPGYSKLPFALQFWTKFAGSDKYEPGPITFSQYLGYDLVIHTLKPHNGLTYYQPIVVPDVLNRSNEVHGKTHTDIFSKMRFDPFFMFHILYDYNTSILKPIGLIKGEQGRAEDLGINLPLFSDGGYCTSDHIKYDQIVYDMISEVS